ncbi:MAG: hypothetical protein Q8N85_06105 [Candidatus Omnitrophota bacterium]|nr:hypothetical protein [Candidatus Omnitrophota bacterium]
MRCIRHRIIKGIREVKRLKRHHKKRFLNFLQAIRLYSGMPVGI